MTTAEYLAAHQMEDDMKELTLATARISKQRNYFLVEFMGREAIHERPLNTLSEAIAFCSKYDLEIIEIAGLSKPRPPVPNF